MAGYQFIIAAVAALGFAAPVAAATLQESALTPFSGDWAHPTVIAPDVTGIRGTTGGNAYDIFQLFLPAAGEITLTFSAGSRMEYSYSAGTVVKYATTPFPWAWSGDTLGGVDIAWGSQGDKSLTLASQGGPLYLALYNTHGTMDYTISGFGAPPVPSVDTVPAAVPLPAAGLLLAGAAGALALIARRRVAV